MVPGLIASVRNRLPFGRAVSETSPEAQPLLSGEPDSAHPCWTSSSRSENPLYSGGPQAHQSSSSAGAESGIPSLEADAAGASGQPVPVMRGIPAPQAPISVSQATGGTSGLGTALAVGGLATGVAAGGVGYEILKHSNDTYTSTAPPLAPYNSALNYGGAGLGYGVPGLGLGAAGDPLATAMYASGGYGGLGPFI